MVELRYRANFLGGISAGLALARIYRLRGELEQAQKMIDRLKNDTLQINNTDLLPGIEAAQAEQWLSQGNVSSAVRWARSFQADLTRGKVLKFELPLLTKTRILVKHGAEDDARELQQRLEAELPDLEAHHFTYRAIQTRAHLALVYNRLGLADEATEALRRAITLAQPGGLIRSFVDCGPSLVPLLRQLQRQGIAPNYLSQVLAAFPVDQRPPTGDLRNLIADGAGQISLTSREIDVLRLMQAGLTNQDIADELVISVYTVKRHITNIYNKLVVDNRVQAVRKARQLGLLPSD
jgi:LuxR family maltose regulon positive regulatory protein